MRITIEHTVDRQLCIVECPSDDLKVQHVLQMVHRALLAAGFAEESITEFLPLEKLNHGH